MSEIAALTVLESVDASMSGRLMDAEAMLASLNPTQQAAGTTIVIQTLATLAAASSGLSVEDIYERVRTSITDSALAI